MISKSDTKKKLIKTLAYHNLIANNIQIIDITMRYNGVCFVPKDAYLAQVGGEMRSEKKPAC